MFADQMKFWDGLMSATKETFVTSSATTTTYAMSVDETILRVTTDAANAITVYLPKVADAKGRIYSIALITDGGVDVTLTDAGDETGWTDLTLADALDRVVVMSDGRYWHLLANIGAA